jgi:hypothetical protein
VAGFVKSLSTIWRIAVPYFRSEDHRWGRLLLVSVITIALGLVGTSVLLNRGIGQVLYWKSSISAQLQRLSFSSMSTSFT